MRRERDIVGAVAAWDEDMPKFRSRMLEKAIRRMSSFNRPDLSGDSYIVGAFDLGGESLSVASARSKSTAMQIVRQYQKDDRVSRIVVERPGYGVKSWIYTEYGRWREKTGSESITAKLLDDYGISDALSRKLKPIMADILRSYKKGDYEGPLKYKGRRLAGRLVDIADRDMPEDLRHAISEFEYEVKFGLLTQNIWSDNNYHVGENKVILIYNLALVPVLVQYGEFDRYRSKIFRDIRRYPVSIRHEVTHALRDAMTGHIRRYVERRDKSKAVTERYLDRGHVELEFEIDATVNSLAVLKRRFPKRWERMDFGDMEKYMPGVRLPRKGDPVWREWIKRLHREGLLTQKIMDDAGVRASTRTSSSPSVSAMRGALRAYAKRYAKTNGNLPDSGVIEKYAREWWDAQNGEMNPNSRVRNIIRELRREGYVASGSRGFFSKRIELGPPTLAALISKMESRIRL